jgi:hypothetical protein
MGFLRVWLLLGAVLVVLYLFLSVWLRLAERRRLAAEWEMEGRRGDRAAFMAAGMAEYDRSLRRRLLWGVIVGPMAGLAVLLYLLNVA